MPEDQTTQQISSDPVPQEIRGFLESLLEDAGMVSLDNQMHEEMIRELYARLDQHIISTVIENLSPQKIEEFIKMNEEKRPQAEIEQYLKENLPNAQDVFTKAFVGFRELYLGNVSIAKNQAVDQPSVNNANHQN